MSGLNKYFDKCGFKFSNVARKFSGIVMVFNDQAGVETAMTTLTDSHRKISKVHMNESKKIKIFLNKMLKPKTQIIQKKSHSWEVILQG